MIHKWAASPYLVWMVIFIVVPIILVGYCSLTSRLMGIQFSTENFTRFFEPIYLKVLSRSLELALIATAVLFRTGLSFGVYPGPQSFPAHECFDHAPGRAHVDEFSAPHLRLDDHS